MTLVFFAFGFKKNLFTRVNFFSLSKNVHFSPNKITGYILQKLLVLFCRAQIGETTDNLNRLEGDLTMVQDSNSEASKELSALEREARELNLTSEQLHHQLDVLKNSNFLGEKKRKNRVVFIKCP